MKCEFVYQYIATHTTLLNVSIKIMRINVLNETYDAKLLLTRTLQLSQNVFVYCKHCIIYEKYQKEMTQRITKIMYILVHVLIYHNSLLIH